MFVCVCIYISVWNHAEILVISKLSKLLHRILHVFMSKFLWTKGKLVSHYIITCKLGVKIPTWVMEESDSSPCSAKIKAKTNLNLCLRGASCLQWMLRVKLTLLLSKITWRSRLSFYPSSTPVNHCLNQSEQSRVEQCEQGAGISLSGTWVIPSDWNIRVSITLHWAPQALPGEPAAPALPAWASPHPDSMSRLDVFCFWPWTGRSVCLNVDFPLCYSSLLWIMGCLGKNQGREGKFLSNIKNVCLNDFILHADEVLQDVLRQ